MAGDGRGSFYLPEVEDEVLVAFEHGDPGYPCVLGALWNGKAKPPEANADGKNNVQMIRTNSRGVLQVDTGSLYPALHRLEREGSIAASWEVSENRQRVRVYRLTAAGRNRLAAERSKWEQLSEAIAGIFAPPMQEGT